MGDWRELLAECEQHIHKGISLAAPVSIPKSTKRIIYCGMGGSGLAGGVIQELTYEAGLNVILVPNFDFPAQFVTTNTIVIINSYSGNTQETLQCYRSALKEKAKVIVMSSGGTLMASAQRQKIAHITLPKELLPRQSLYYQIGAFIGLLDKSQHAPSAQTALLEFKKYVGDFPFARRSNAIAKAIGTNTPVVYASHELRHGARRWLTQWSENAKRLGHAASFPELNHNEIMGFDNQQKNTTLIILRRERESKNTKKSIDVFTQLVRSQVDNIRSIELPGRNPICSLLIACLLGDWVSYQLAEMHNIDANNNSLIDQYKSQL